MSVIFVSSTFRDMHAERDVIRDVTAPLVNEVARRYGQFVSFEDLRWGIDTQHLSDSEADQKVLDICLDEIDRSDPPMIVILGDRYGWMPGIDAAGNETGSTLIADTAARRRDFDLEDDLISVTALEVEYGALRERSSLYSKTLLFYRNIEGECDESVYANEGGIHAVKREELRRRVERVRDDCAAQDDSPLREYTVRFIDGRPDPGDIDRFARLVAERVIEAMLPQWRALDEKGPLERTLAMHDHLMASKGALLTARASERDRLVGRLAVGRGAHIIVKGDSGSGKTTLLAAVGQRLRGDAARDVLFLSCGYTSDTSDAMGILRLVVGWLASLDPSWAIPDIETRSRQTLTSDLEDLAERCRESARDVVILIDAADQLSPDENRDKLLFLPRSLAISYCMTCTSDFNVGARECECLEPLSSQEERRRVLDSLKRSEGWNELSEETTRRLLARPAAASPLYLSMAMQALLMLGRDDYAQIESRRDVSPIDAIDERLADVLASSPDSLALMGADLIMRAADRAGRGAETTRLAIQYLAVSRRGLRREDLERLVEARFGEGARFDQAGLARLVNYFPSCFITRGDGRIDFMHKSIREGLLAGIPTDDLEGPDGMHADILRVLAACDPDDPVRMGELVYHAFHARDHGLLCEYVASCGTSGHASAFVGSSASVDAHRRSETARDLRECSEADESDWFGRQLEEIGDAAVAAGVVDFLDKVVYPFPVIGQLSMSELLPARQTLGHNRVLARKLMWGEPSHETRRRLAEACFCLAYTQGTIRGFETRGSLEAYAEAYKMRKQDRDADPEAYAYSCDNLASNLLRAVQEGIAPSPTLFPAAWGLAWDGQTTRGGWHGGRDDDLKEQRICELFAEELTIRMAILNEAQKAAEAEGVDQAGLGERLFQARENAAWALSNMAKAVRQYPESPHVAEYDLASLYDRALDLRELNLTQRPSDLAAMEKVAYSCVDAARHRLGSGTEESLGQAERLVCRACELRERVRDQSSTSKSVIDLASAYNIRARVLDKCGRWAEAVSCGEKAITQSRRAVRVLGTVLCKLALAEYLRNLARMLATDAVDVADASGAEARDARVAEDGVEESRDERPRGVEARVARACELLGESAGVLEEVLAGARTRDCAISLVFVYDELIAIYERIADGGYDAEHGATHDAARDAGRDSKLDFELGDVEERIRDLRHRRELALRIGRATTPGPDDSSGDVYQARNTRH